MLQDVLPFDAPDAAFYLWARVPGGDDAAFARELYRDYNVTVLPGSFLAREAHGINPGKDFVRIALVANLEACVEAARRIAASSARPHKNSVAISLTLPINSTQESIMQELQNIIEEAFERRADITPRNVEPQVKDAVMTVIDMLDKGKLRVAEKIDGQNGSPTSG